MNHMSHLCEFMFSVLSMANLVYSSFKMLKCHVIKDFVALSFHNMEFILCLKRKIFKMRQLKIHFLFKISFSMLSYDVH